MKSFSNPSLMMRFRLLQIRIGNADLIKPQRHAPAFDVLGER
jgi:hypothetical protein